MKKIILLLSLLCMFSGISVFAFEYNIPVCVKVNGEYIKFENEPILIDGITYLPVRFFCEALSAQVDWEDKTKTVTVISAGNEIVFTIGSSTAYINGIPYLTGGSAKLIGGLTYLPLRFIAESLGGDVSWNSNYFTAEIIMDNLQLNKNVSIGRDYADDEIYWLAKIISCESENQPMNGKVAVGNVVLNRVESDQFPNTIYSVIHDKKHGYQFSPVADGSIKKEPVKDAYLAAKLCLEGYNVVSNCLYFLNPDKATSHWIPQNRKFFTSIGDHDFYY